LCGSKEPLRNSHIIPKFAVKWLKETSATGYFRYVSKPNVRMQDGIREKMLCDDCENLFSRDENLFSSEIFTPYVTKELDNWGRSTGTISSIPYGEWLLRFALSVNWRVMARSLNNEVEDITSKSLRILQQQELQIRQYLTGRTSSTGANETHLIFLQNLIGGSGSLPPSMHPNVNSYLLRSNDATLMISQNGKRVHVYSKVGPIALVTAIRPSSLNRLKNTKLHKKGVLCTSQKILNHNICDFIYITRPNTAFAKLHYSDKQMSRISETLIADPEKAMSSMSMRAFESKLIMEKILNEEGEVLNGSD
jgi:hypothetical protein